MIDIHNHTLFGIDDGAQTIEETIQMLQKAKQQGVDQLILTPHYVLDGSYHASKEKVKELINTINNQANQLGITLYEGHELFIHRDLYEHLKQQKCCTLANSKYILIEFPFDHYDDEYDYILEDLRSLGYKIIIAHPERYQYVRKNLNFCLRWLDEGDLLQCNQNSFLRKENNKMMKKLVTHGFVSFVASDAHGERRPNLLSDVYQVIASNYGEDMAKQLCYTNAKAIIDNQEIKNESYKPIRTIFGKY